MKMTVRGIIFFGIYIFLITLPLDTALLSNPARAAKPFIVEFAVGAGFIGFSLMALEFALISRIEAAAQPFGEDSLQLFHNIMGVVALGLILLHPIILVFSGYPANCWLNPFADCGNLATRTASLSLIALILLVGTSLWRKNLRIPYEAWQVMHGFLAIFVLIAALFHIFILGRYTSTDLMKVMWLIYAVLVVGLILWYKILSPILNWNKKWQVHENRAERGDAHTLVLEPVGHDGFSFEPGQYAWIKKGKTPFGVGQHPISFSSSGDVPPGGQVSFTIKKLGDWSQEQVPEIKPGDYMWIDGPHGVLSSDREQGMGYILIAGGIGITPLYSMCQTMAERGDVRPVVLFYGGNQWESLTFREELEQLSSKMDLRIVFVLSQPPEDWKGERGFINREILERHLPEQYKRFVYFICGPSPLMDAMEEALPNLGVPAEKVFSERFGMV
ncbi:MAG: ferric reductase-like transmembrane domain-containing protein [Chloroflexota bacterium]|nr:MAG: ferric reductase-like transmembrane domain-containing protein [Chloroflexota bacterium]